MTHYSLLFSDIEPIIPSKVAYYSEIILNKTTNKFAIMMCTILFIITPNYELNSYDAYTMSSDEVTHY